MTLSLHSRTFASLYHDIDTFTSAFIHYRCHRPSSNTTDQHTVSPTELYRIHCAIWRLWTLCELGCRRPLVNQQWRLDQAASAAICIFLFHVTSWKLEEIECTYSFMRDIYHRQPVRLEPSSKVSMLASSSASRSSRSSLFGSRWSILGSLSSGSISIS